MADENQVKLHAAWPSPFVYRVIWALKLKGIAYEYVEEDLLKKSALLLKYNPVHKKIPVLVHGEKPVCESMVVLEYIEEAWPQNYQLLPNDPYDRAVTRFWIKFAEDKSVAVWKMLRSTGQEFENAMRETSEMLQIVEERGFGKKKFFNGDKIGTVDLAFGSIFHWLQIIEDLKGEKVFESQKFPRLYEWLHNFKQVPVIAENIPSHEEVLAFFRRRLEQFSAYA